MARERDATPLVPAGTSFGASDAGLTMVELLVCLGILAFTLGGVLSVFFAGARLGQRSQERSEAGRIAQAVFDLAEAGAGVPTVTWGRRGDGTIAGDGTTIDNRSTCVPPGIVAATLTRAPASASDPLVEEPVEMAWRATITGAAPADFDGLTGVHYVVVTVFVEQDGVDGPSAGDREVGEFVGLLSDR